MNAFKQNGYTIKVDEESVGYSTWKLVVVTISVKRSGENSKYMVVSKPGGTVPYSTIRKCLESSSYRKKYLVNGYKHCLETFEFMTNKGINVFCEKAIKEFKRKSKKETLNRADYVALKSFGTDKFSTMGIPDLLSYTVVAKNEEELRGVFSSEEHLASTMRWVVRGLSPKHAIQRELLLIMNDNSYRADFVHKRLDANLLNEVSP